MAITPEQILEKDFSLARKDGFEPNEVRNYLAAVARGAQRQLEEVSALQAEVDRLRAEIDDLRRGVVGAPSVGGANAPDDIGEMVKEMVAAVMKQADDTAAELVADAERHAARVRADA